VQVRGKKYWGVGDGVLFESGEKPHMGGGETLGLGQNRKKGGGYRGGKNGGGNTRGGDGKGL